ncbi:MAG: flagellar hook-basal body protein [Planctomycetota bacterium]|nr:flagellar hook-basal body protein [Planctomycetota bacterium]
MNYGLYLSAAGALTNMHRQDVFANNLANVNTVGFKPDSVITRQRLPERLESPGSMADPQRLLEQLTGGQFLQPTRVSLAQGNLVQTEGDLDLALEGEGLFVIGDGRGTGPEHLRFTRDGRFTLNPDGELVMAANSMRVLDRDDLPIRLDSNATVRIDEQGVISQNGAAVAELKIVAAPHAERLAKAGDNLLRLADGAPMPQERAAGRVRQGYTESSAVDPILTLNSMMSAAKAARSNLRMIQYHDNILEKAFNTFGRVA